MELKILGSSSSGNCYVLDNGKEALILEAGVAYSEVMKSLDFDISRVAGCLISHEHGDHCKEVGKFLDARIPVFASIGTIENCKQMQGRLTKAQAIEDGIVYKIGNFKVQAFDVQHDCAEPFGFLIHHTETGMVLFATDTYYLAYTFKGLNNILIECNYRLDILEENINKGLLPEQLRARTMESHMSYETCKETLLVNDLKAVNNIVLIHLSSGNSNAKEFQQGIKEATGKSVHIASKGMKLNFGKTPF